MEEILNKLKDFFTKSPEYIYLTIGMVFLILFMGVLKDKKWAIDPNSGHQRFFYNTFGHKAFRLIIGVIYLLGLIAGFGMTMLYAFNKI